MLRWFDCRHLPPHLQAVVGPYRALAESIEEQLEPSAERSVALRKLLESKDAAVRAAIETTEHRAKASEHIQTQEK